MKKSVLGFVFAFCIIVFGNLPSSASYYHYPCFDSSTVCRNGDCVTYCNDNKINTVIYNRPLGYSFNYAGPFGGISISNNHIGIGIYGGSSIKRRPVYHNRPTYKPAPPAYNRPHHKAPSGGHKHPRRV